LKTVLIFRTQLLERSETFIRAQAENLLRYDPHYVGWRHKTDGLAFPREKALVINTGGLAGKLREARFRLLGPGYESLRTLRALGPRLVHAHFGLDACEALSLARRLHLPLVTTFHGYDATMKDSTLRQWRTGRKFIRLRPHLQDRGSLFIAVSEFVRNRLLSMGFPPERTVVHYIGVDADKFSPSDPGIRQPAVLFVGRLVEKKGCSYLLRAMSEVQRVAPETRLVIIGDGPEKQNLHNLARKLGVRVEFLGAQPPDVVLSWMTLASVFCVPSVTANNGDSEGFGIVFAEAQACATPVVSFATGGIPEAVAHGKTGLLAPERDWQTLASSLLLLLRNNELRSRLGLAGRRRVVSQFNLRKQTALLEDLYDHAVVGSLPSRHITSMKPLPKELGAES